MSRQIKRINQPSDEIISLIHTCRKRNFRQLSTVHDYHLLEKPMAFQLLVKNAYQKAFISHSRLTRG